MEAASKKVCSKSCEGAKLGVDFVREEYKRYKKKDPPPDLSNVVEFGDDSTYTGRVERVELGSTPCESPWLKCASEWKVFGLMACPGFYFIKNPFKTGAEKYWIERCCRDFPKKPNASNLDAHIELNADDSVWEMSQRDGSQPDLINKLSWVHLGYKFDYNFVDYVPEKYYGFPDDLATLTRHIAEAIGHTGYNPETGIVNYYGLSRSMGGHTDHYEQDQSSPLISLSFGQSAIFLIGGKTRDVRPTALFLHSGDIIVLSGESRLAFHAVPKIMRVTETSEDAKKVFLKDFDWNRQPCEVHPNEHASSKNNEGNYAEEQKVTEGKTEDLTQVSESDSHSTESIGEKYQAYENCEGFVGSSFQGKNLEYLSAYISRTRININVRQVHSL